MEKKPVYKRIWFILLLFILLWHFLFRRKGYYTIPVKLASTDETAEVLPHRKKSGDPLTESAAPAKDTSSLKSEAVSAPGLDAPDLVYWVSGGKIYHSSDDCWSLIRSKSIFAGTLDKANDAGKTKPCNLCVRLGG